MGIEGLIGVMIPIFGMVFIAALVIVPRYFKSLERQKVADTLRAAIEKGQPLPPEIVDAIARDTKLPPSPARDLRTGIIWLGVAVGLAAFGIAIGFEEPDATFPMVAFAAFPGFIGLAFIVLGLINRTKA
ncbi:DUF6249 domain-containing protein [Phenylobacterium sp.]|uniref:DUF6249 domain-containing protein n=1 Tax=Phenylobacterium sp. TaxID=1871053 RepID=UPI002F930B64